MNLRSLAIVVVVIVLIICAVFFIFFRELAKEITPAPLAVAPKVVTEQPPVAYVIPANAIPSISDIEAKLKQTAEQRVVEKEMSAKIKAESAARRKDIQAQLEAEAAAPKKETVEVPEQPAKQAVKLVKPPPREEREKMKAAGVVSF